MWDGRPLATHWCTEVFPGEGVDLSKVFLLASSCTTKSGVPLPPNEASNRATPKSTAALFQASLLLGWNEKANHLRSV